MIEILISIAQRRVMQTT